MLVDKSNRSLILVVDDTPTNLTMISGLLSDEYNVKIANNGEKALNMIMGGLQPDLILLDIMMPGMNGYDVMRVLKQIENAKDIPVIFVSALDSEEDEETGLLLGAADYICKPFSPAIARARIANHVRFHRQRKLLESLAGRDGLTELCNRRRFDDILDREWKRCRRNEAPLSLAMVDVDFFKRYNDNYGHAPGDEVLKAVAKGLSNAVQRPSDVVARFGGEEFVMLFPDTDALGGRILAEKACLAVRELAIPHAFSQASSYVSVSVGGATLMGDENEPCDLIKAADSILYEAKQSGRDRALWR